MRTRMRDENRQRSRPRLRTRKVDGRRKRQLSMKDKGLRTRRTNAQCPMTKDEGLAGYARRLRLQSRR
jgi:hypothetical protein